MFFYFADMDTDPLEERRLQSSNWLSLEKLEKHDFGDL